MFTPSIAKTNGQVHRHVSCIFGDYCPGCEKCIPDTNCDTCCLNGVDSPASRNKDGEHLIVDGFPACQACYDKAHVCQECHCKSRNVRLAEELGERLLCEYCIEILHDGEIVEDDDGEWEIYDKPTYHVSDDSWNR